MASQVVFENIKDKRISLGSLMQIITVKASERYSDQPGRAKGNSWERGCLGE